MHTYAGSTSMGMEILSALEKHAAAVMAIATVILVGITAFYALRTHQILKEQRKAAEYNAKPQIKFSRMNCSTIQCEVQRNDVINLAMTVTINNKSERQELGGAFVGLESSWSYPVPTANPKAFDAKNLLENLKEGSKLPVRIVAEYLSPTGGEYEEEFFWASCEVTKKGIEINGPRPDDCKLNKKPW